MSFTDDDSDTVALLRPEKRDNTPNKSRSPPGRKYYTVDVSISKPFNTSESERLKWEFPSFSNGMVRCDIKMQVPTHKKLNFLRQTRTRARYGFCMVCVAWVLAILICAFAHNYIMVFLLILVPILIFLYGMRFGFDICLKYAVDKDKLMDRSSALDYYSGYKANFKIHKSRSSRMMGANGRGIGSIDDIELDESHYMFDTLTGLIDVKTRVLYVYETGVNTRILDRKERAKFENRIKRQVLMLPLQNMLSVYFKSANANLSGQLQLDAYKACKVVFKYFDCGDAVLGQLGKKNFKKLGELEKKGADVVGGVKLENVRTREMNRYPVTKMEAKRFAAWFKRNFPKYVEARGSAGDVGDIGNVGEMR